MNILIDELIVNQDTVRNTNKNYIGLEGLDIDNVVTGLTGYVEVARWSGVSGILRSHKNG